MRVSVSGRVPLVGAAYVVPLRTTPDGALEVLLQLRRGTGYYDDHWACAAAGHLEVGESLLEAAVREAGEELGIAVVLDDLEPLTAMHRRHGSEANEQRLDAFFALRTWGGTPSIQEPDKCAQLRWFPLGELPTPVVPHELAVIQRLVGGLPAVITFGS